jgi:hypothetical protein
LRTGDMRRAEGGPKGNGGAGRGKDVSISSARPPVHFAGPIYARTIVFLSRAPRICQCRGCTRDRGWQTGCSWRLPGRAPRIGQCTGCKWDLGRQMGCCRLGGFQRQRPAVVRTASMAAAVLGSAQAHLLAADRLRCMGCTSDHTVAGTRRRSYRPEAATARSGQRIAM